MVSGEEQTSVDESSKINGTPGSGEHHGKADGQTQSQTNKLTSAIRKTNTGSMKARPLSRQ